MVISDSKNFSFLFVAENFVSWQSSLASYNIIFIGEGMRNGFMNDDSA